MKTLLGNKNNLYAVAFNASAKTLTFTNVIGWDMSSVSIVSIWDTTVSLPFVLGKNIVSVTYSYVVGLPVWVFTLGVVPAGSANGDALVTILNVPEVNAMYDLTLVVAGATV